MATATAPTPVPPAQRPLWQVPMFLVGALSLVALWNYGDRIRPTLGERYNRSLIQLRQALDQMPPNIDQLQAGLRKLPSNEPPPELAGQVRFIVGSAYVALAEGTTSPHEASEYWAKAKDYFDQVTDLKQIPESESRRFRYRRARMWANTGSNDPQRIIDSITETITSGDDLAEGYRLMADQYTKLPNAEENKVRDALQGYLKHAGTRADARTLNQARVRLAELHAKLHESEEARKVIERVGPDAPPELYAAAKLLASKFALEDEDWNNALKAAEIVRDLKGATDAQKAQALIQEAEAYQRSNRPDKARTILLKDAPKIAGTNSRQTAIRMAAVSLAEQTLNLDEAVTQLEAAIKGVRGPRDWPTTDAPIGEVRKLCMEAYHKAAAVPNWPLALRAAKALNVVADDSEAQHLLAKAHEELAAKLSADPTQLDEARPHYRAAGDVYTALSRQAPNGTTKAEFVRKAAALHHKGDDRAKAIAVLNELVQKATDVPEAQIGSAWSELGDIYNQRKETKNALQAYENAAARRGPAQLHAKVRYAGLLAEDPTKVPTATTMLEEIVALPEVPVQHKSVHEECLYRLGELLAGAREWQKAEPRLRSALAAYPDSPHAPKGRLLFGQCFRHRANLEARQIEKDRATLLEIKNERLQNRRPAHRVDEQIKLEDRISQTWKNYDEFLKQAYEAIRQAETHLLATAGVEAELLKRASFYAADCAHWLGMYDECEKRYTKLAERYRHKAEELEALSYLHRCCRFAISAATEAKNSTDANRWAIKQGLVYKQMQDALTTIPEAELDNTMDVRKRGYWELWLKENAPRAGIREKDE